MKVWTCIILLSLSCSLWGESDRRAEGDFNTSQQEDGRYLVEFKGKNIDVRSYFPENPKFYAQTAYYIMENPLIQFFLIISPHQDISNDDMIRMTLAQIAREYRGLNLDVINIDRSEKKSGKKDGLTQTNQKFVIDLENGFRELVILHLYRNKQYDVSTLTRFTLSSSEKEDLTHRMNGNQITNRFHDETTVTEP